MRRPPQNLSGEKMGNLIGYARVSTEEQELDLQISALLQAGCAKKDIFTDKISGSKSERPGLKRCLEYLREGDCLVVWRLDRLGRSMIHLVTLVEDLHKRKISFKSLNDGAIDTTTASGELIFNIFSSLAQFERRLIQERTKAGLEAARERGKVGGRKPTKANDPKVKMAKQMHQDPSITIKEICDSLKISKATFYRYISL